MEENVLLVVPLNVPMVFEISTVIPIITDHPHHYREQRRLLPVSSSPFSALRLS
jgi:hypothetical protein